QQLEKAAEREDRRPQLVRRVRDELAARVVEAREPAAHAVERAGELAELVPSAVLDRLGEVAGGDPVGGALEAANPPREERRGPEPGDEGDGEPDERGPEQPGAYEIDVLERRMERRREEQDVAGAVRDRGFREIPAPAVDAAALHADRGLGPERHRVARDRIGDGELRRVEDRIEDGPRPRAERLEVDDARVGRL